MGAAAMAAAADRGLGAAVIEAAACAGVGWDRWSGDPGVSAWAASAVEAGVALLLALAAWCRATGATPAAPTLAPDTGSHARVGAVATVATVATEAERGSARRAALFWWAAAAVLAVLALNKQLDVQLLVAEYGRCLARDLGLDGYRWEAKAAFAALLGLAGLAAMAAAWWLSAGLATRVRWVALAGTAVLAGFVALRVATATKLATRVGLDLAALPGTTLVEMAGPGLMALAALLALGAQRPAGG
ncbi:MAG: hypothetical protein AAF677_14570 [Pseudomonadota bacterium]